jgi:hypothetical protein
VALEIGGFWYRLNYAHPDQLHSTSEMRLVQLTSGDDHKTCQQSNVKLWNITNSMWFQKQLSVLLRSLGRNIPFLVSRLAADRMGADYLITTYATAEWRIIHSKGLKMGNDIHLTK